MAGPLLRVAQIDADANAEDAAGLADVAARPRACANIRPAVWATLAVACIFIWLAIGWAILTIARHLP